MSKMLTYKYTANHYELFCVDCGHRILKTTDAALVNKTIYRHKQEFPAHRINGLRDDRRIR